MTKPNYNERLDEILTRLENLVSIDTAQRMQTHKSGQSPKKSHTEAKSALTQLIKDLVAEAKPEISDNTFSTDRPAHHLTLGRNTGIQAFEQNLLKLLEDK